MTCPDCQGPVDVVCHNGAALRCGCGHTTVTAPPRPPIERYGDHGALRALLKVLTEHKVTAYKAAGVEITLAPSAWKVEAAAEPKVDAAPADKACACGHWLHDHGQVGCLLGCPLEACGLEEEKAA